MARQNQKMTAKNTKNLDKAVRKLEAKEQKQANSKSAAERAKAAAGPTRSVGRAIRDGWISGA